MLTEKGFDAALKLSSIPAVRRDSLRVKSYEVQKVVKKLVEATKPQDYNPFDISKKIVKTTTEFTLRDRGFRQAIVETYDCRCSVCGLKIKSPDSLSWEVEAAHIVPNYFRGRDDIWNGVALCHFHHWAFDVGWFTLLDNYRILVSQQINHVPADFGKMGSYECVRSLVDKAATLFLPKRTELYPHLNAIRWHRQNIFDKQL